MGDFCGSNFWNTSFAWDSLSPDFTPCFNETVIVWLPCAFLWIAAPYEVYKIRNEKPQTRNRIPRTIISSLRIMLAVLLAVLTSVELIHTLTNITTANPFDYYTPLIKLVTFCLASLLMSHNRKKAISSSGVIFIFWFLLPLCTLISYFSLIFNVTNPSSTAWFLDPTAYTIKIISIALILTQSSLYFMSDGIRVSFLSYGQDENPSPRKAASFLSNITFSWFDSIIALGARKPLTSEDMYDLPQEDQTKELFLNYCKNWSYDKNPSIVWPLVKTFWPQLLSTAILKLLCTILGFSSPVLLDYFLVWMEGNEPYWRGFFIAILMFIASSLWSILQNNFDYILAIAGLQMKTVVKNAIYQKSLKLSSTSKTQFTTGQIINLMSVDTDTIDDYLNVAHYWWSAPIEFAIAIYLLWAQMGIATLAGVASLLVIISLNSLLARRLLAISEELMDLKDERIKLTNEVLNGIKVLKLYAWEDSFSQQIEEVRDQELRCLRIQSYYMSVMEFITDSSSIFVALLTFVAFTLIDSNNVLDASKTFVSLSLFNLLLTPLTCFTQLLELVVMSSVAVNRINKFLASEQMNMLEITQNKDKDGNALKVSNGTYSWREQVNDISLQNINVSIKAGKLVAVVGMVGSGKSSLLSAFLGDMHRITGRMNISGKVAYVPQQAWIQNTSLRRNVLFTNKYDYNKFNKVIEACALTPDLDVLPARDLTEIGEKGINLSGGQKQRVSLARAVYSNADIYLLDDPLSAVDSHVGKHIFDKLIGPNGILKKKTRVLVTHRVALLPQVDEIIVMKDGRVSEQGTYQELLDQKGAFADFLVEYLADADEDEALAEIRDAVKPELERFLSKQSNTSSDQSPDTEVRKRMLSISRQSSVVTEHIQDDKTRTPDDQSTDHLMEEETAATGSIKAKVLLNYVKSIGIVPAVGILSTTVLAGVFNLSSSLWLTEWSNDAEFPDRLNDTSLRNWRLSVYSSLGVSEAIFLLVSGILVFLGTLRASYKIHNDMLKHIVRAPMSFFDTTPLGRILNRFIEDIDRIDSDMPGGIRQVLTSLSRAIIALIVISLQSANVILAMLPVFILYYLTQKYYVKTSRQLTRISSIASSPIYSHFTETISGSTCIRAFGATQIFEDECEKRIDTDMKVDTVEKASYSWLAMRLELIANLFLLIVVLFSAISRSSVSASMAGLTINYVLTITTTLTSLVHINAAMQNNSVSLERCFEYTKTPTEAAYRNSYMKPVNSWPAKGNIRFENYSTRYRPGLELVVRDITFEIKSKEKVGIVGRTGAGKSSLTLALFRLIEPVSGTIIIDGEDVSQLGLYDLRSKLSIIPQDPVLFTGTLRLNLDPFNAHTDQDLWNSLELANLKEFVVSLENGLGHTITEGGENLSVGQRQLVCLARALLRKSKILVLDEATAAVDMGTDELIQKTIRTEFADCTILTIAHRLDTVMDYDRILVMDKGKVAEYDTLQNLLRNNTSIFYAMAKDAGIPVPS